MGRFHVDKPTYTSSERLELFLYLFVINIRTNPFGEKQFCVCVLPKQEFGQPLLAAGPDHEVDVAEPGFAGDELGKYLAGEMAYIRSLRHRIQDCIAG